MFDVATDGRAEAGSQFDARPAKVHIGIGSHMPEQPAAKKRQAKPGTQRVTVKLLEEEYTYLQSGADAEMREINNYLSFLLRGKIMSPNSACAHRVR